MSLIKSKDTKPERLVRAILTALGVRYRLHRYDLPGRPDVFVPRLRVALLVQGCYWHQHDCKAGNRQPATHTDYWLPKLQANAERDVANRKKLEDQGISTLYLWTCQVKDFEDACRRLARRYKASGRKLKRALY